jgi:VanZ family protein
VRNSGKLRFSTYWTVLGLVYVAVVVYLSLAPAPPPDVLPYPQVDKAVHFLAYAFLMLWFGQIYHQRSAALLIASGLVMLGILLETLQGLSGYRTFEYTDMAANTLGVVSGFCVARTRLGNLLGAFEMRLTRRQMP